MSKTRAYVCDRCRKTELETTRPYGWSEVNRVRGAVTEHLCQGCTKGLDSLMDDKPQGTHSPGKSLGFPLEVQIASFKEFLAAEEPGTATYISFASRIEDLEDELRELTRPGREP